MNTEPGVDTSGNPSEGEVALLAMGEALQVVWRRMWIILLMTLVVGGAALGFSLTRTPLYEASINVLVGQTPGSSSGQPVGAYDLQQLTGTMAEAVNSRTVAEQVIQQQGLQMTPDEILGHLSADQVKATQFIEIKYRDSSPQRAQEVANSIGDVFSEQVSQTSATGQPIVATVWERAEMPGAPISPNYVRYIGLGLLAGLLIGVGLAFLLEYLDDSWRSPEEAEQISGVPTFGVIPAFEVSNSKKGRG